MSIIGSELFLSACLTPLHCTLSEETPERKHFLQPWPQDPLPTLTFILLPAHFFTFGFGAWFFFFFHPFLLLVIIDLFTGEQADRIQRAARPVPWDTQICTFGAVCQRSCFTKTEGRGGGMTKTTACVGEHCLRLRLEIFSEKKGFYTQWSWVWKKGAHIKRSAFMCGELVIF